MYNQKDLFLKVKNPRFDEEALNLGLRYKDSISGYGVRRLLRHE